ncbi:glycosyltransferase family 4 protein [Pseudonocardia alni]|uniref:glycosyltransferase family 4 protein n=1 Tax=Pseudonocardia alni TaxID=33907 RepID=UPI0027A679DB|nr:glycosyltransferase family 4 protein [Pseudonocardia alni]
MTDQSRDLAVAYLASEYPAISHTFIEREISMLRLEDVRVVTFTVHAANRADLLTPTMRAEAARTRSLLDRTVGHYVRTLPRFVFGHPVAFLSGLRAAARNGAATPKAKLWQVFYLLEAIVLWYELHRERITHIHAHHANNAADIARLTVVLGRAVGRPSAPWRWTLAMHGSTEFFDPEGYDLAAKVRSADAVACISGNCVDQLRALVEEDHWEKLHIVRMTVDSQTHFVPPADRRAGREGLPLRLLYVGRLFPRKGVEEIIEAAGTMVAAGRDVSVRIVGSGVLEQDLRTLVSRWDLAARVELRGAVGQDELPAHYQWADVFCLPSHAEGVPVVLMEAMASELPVVASDVGGIPELVLDGHSGVLVPAGGVAELVSAVERLDDSVPLRLRLGRNARQHVATEFSAKVNVARLIELVAPE